MHASVSPEEAIGLLTLRAIEIQDLQLSGINYDSPKVLFVRTKINESLAFIFGMDSAIYRDGEYSCLVDPNLFYCANSRAERQMIFEVFLPLAQIKIQFLIQQIQIENSQAELPSANAAA